MIWSKFGKIITSVKSEIMDWLDPPLYFTFKIFQKKIKKKKESKIISVQENITEQRKTPNRSPWAHSRTPQAAGIIVGSLNGFEVSFPMYLSYFP